MFLDEGIPLGYIKLGTIQNIVVCKNNIFSCKTAFLCKVFYGKTETHIPRTDNLTQRTDFFVSESSTALILRYGVFKFGTHLLKGSDIWLHSV